MVVYPVILSFWKMIPNFILISEWVSLLSEFCGVFLFFLVTAVGQSLASWDLSVLIVWRKWVAFFIQYCLQTKYKIFYLENERESNSGRLYASLETSVEMSHLSASSPGFFPMCIFLWAVTSASVPEIH